MNVLALCAGVGGLELGLKLAVPSTRCVAYVEGEAYAASVLAARMEAGDMDQAPIWSDVRTFDGRPWRGVVDCITAGFPCQPFSVAGGQRGLDDERWIWPDIARIVRDVRPGVVFLENVPTLVTTGLAPVLGDLATLGFAAEWGCLTAEAVGAPHRRDRLFILAAHADRRGHGSRGQGAGAWRPGGVGADGTERTVTHADRARLEGHRGTDRVPEADTPADGSRSFWQSRQAPEPAVCRVDDGPASRVDRLRACGNGVVPRQAAEAMRQLARRLEL